MYKSQKVPTIFPSKISYFSTKKSNIYKKNYQKFLRKFATFQSVRIDINGVRNDEKDVKIFHHFRDQKVENFQGRSSGLFGRLEGHQVGDVARLDQLVRGWENENDHLKYFHHFNNVYNASDPVTVYHLNYVLSPETFEWFII